MCNSELQVAVLEQDGLYIDAVVCASSDKLLAIDREEALTIWGHY